MYTLHTTSLILARSTLITLLFPPHLSALLYHHRPYASQFLYSIISFGVLAPFLLGPSFPAYPDPFEGDDITRHPKIQAAVDRRRSRLLPFAFRLKTLQNAKIRGRRAPCAVFLVLTSFLLISVF